LFLAKILQRFFISLIILSGSRILLPLKSHLEKKSNTFTVNVNISPKKESTEKILNSFMPELQKRLFMPELQNLFSKKK